MQTPIHTRPSSTPAHLDTRQQPESRQGAEQLRDPSRPRTGQVAAAGAAPGAPASRRMASQAADQLRPPSSWWRRLLGSFFLGPKTSQLQLAQQRHSELRRELRAASVKAPVAPVGGGLTRSLAALIQSESNGQPYQVFDRITGRLNPEASPQMLSDWLDTRAFLVATPNREEALRAIRSGLSEGRGASRSASQLETQAKTVYLALVDAVRRQSQSPAVRQMIDDHEAEAAQASQAAATAAAADLAAEAAQARVHAAVADLTLRVADLAQVPAAGAELHRRMEGLRQIDAERAALPLDASQASVRRLDTAIASLRGQLLGEWQTDLQAQHDHLAQRPLDQALRELPRQQQLSEEIEALHALVQDWQDPTLTACKAQAGQLQALIAHVRAMPADLARYEGLKIPGLDGQVKHPCEPLAQYLRGASVANGLAVQRSVTSLLARVHAEDEDDLLADLGGGAVDGQGRFSPGLLQDLVAGQREAVDGILSASPWADLGLALKMEGVDRREAEALAGKGADPKEEAAVRAEFDKVRFTTQTHHSLRIANREINRLLLAGRKNGQSAPGDLLGDAGRASGANAWVIQEIRKNAGGLEKSADILLLHWIYLSCLNPATREIDQSKVRELSAQLKGAGKGTVEADQAQGLLKQGYLSSQSIRESEVRIRQMSTQLAAAGGLAKASRDQNIAFTARATAADVVTHITGQPPADESSATLDGAMRAHVQSALDEWHVAAGKSYAARHQQLLGRIAKQDDALGKLGRKGVVLHPVADDRLLTLTVRGVDGAAKAPDHLLSVLAACQADLWQLEGSPVDENGIQRVKPVTDSATKRAIAERLSQNAQTLVGFDPVTFSWAPDSTQVPSTADLRNRLLDLPELDAPLRERRTILALQKAMEGVETTRDDQLQGAVEAALRVAVLLEAVDTGRLDSPLKETPEHFGNPLAGVLNRLKGYGLPVVGNDPVLNRLMRSAKESLESESASLAALSKRLAVGTTNPGKGKPKPGLCFALPPAAGPTPKTRTHQTLAATNSQIIEGRFRELAPGRSFDITLAQSGKVEVSQPVAIGVNADSRAEVRVSSRLKVSRQDSGYLFEVTGDVSKLLGGGLSFLAGVVTWDMGVRADRGEGWRFRCDNEAAAQHLLGAFLGKQALEISKTQGVRLEKLASSRFESSAALGASLSLSASDHLELAKLEGQLLASRGVQVETSRSSYGETERRTASRTRTASGSASLLGGRLSVDAETGSDLAVSWSLHRSGGELRPGSGMRLETQVYGDDVRGGLLRVMPHLAQDKDLLAHYEAQVAQALAAYPTGSTATRSVRLQFEADLTRKAVNLANRHYRAAAAQVAAKAAGRDTAGADAGVAQTLEAVDTLMRDPSSYAVKGLSVSIESSATASKGVALARRESSVAESQVLTLPPPATSASAAASPTALPDAFAAVLGGAAAAAA